LFSIIGIAMSNNLFFLILPLQMKQAGLDSSQVGFAMGMFAAGSILAGLFGSKVVNRVGHIRAFASMAATLSIVAIAHTFLDSFALISALRMVAGFCFITSFITLESWLNVMSDSSNRGKLFSVYQIFFALGFGSAPFLMEKTGQGDIRLYGLVSAVLAIALIIMAMSRIPQPELPGRARAMALKKLWNYSPSGTFSCLIAGSIGSASVSLIALYAYARGFSGVLLSVILGSYLLGGLLTQYPTGWFADRFDKRTVGAVLMLVGILSNAIIIIDYYSNLPTSLVVVFFLLSGGAGAAIFPLAVTQVFDHIETKEALPATSTMQILLGVGGIFGPIIAGALMTAFSEIWLYFYVIVLHLLLMAFLLVRKLFLRTERLEPAQPYQVTTNPVSVPPLEEYVAGEIAEPALKLLIEALKQDPKNPRVLIKTMFDSTNLRANEVALQMVLKLPKRAGELMENFVALYPERRLEVAEALTDFFDLHKTRINYAIVAGLKTDASEEEIAEIDRLIAIRKKRLEEAGLPVE
ncbi:MAG TPA: MFS transporter, partial [Marinobacterium sp.]|nr:MFS transporter [Marinobacterium sp.]